MRGDRVVFKLVFELKRGKRQLLIRGGLPAGSSVCSTEEDGWKGRGEGRGVGGERCTSITTATTETATTIMTIRATGPGTPGFYIEVVFHDWKT